MRRWANIFSLLLLVLFCGQGMAFSEEVAVWDLETLYKAPAVIDLPASSTAKVKAVFFEGLPFKGKPTKVFAYYGIPELAPGHKAPAMVLVHGGGGSAYIPWVELWLSRGYAAIAMDTCGCVSSGGYQSHPRHADGGPAGWGGFDQIDDPIEDQWAYHAVADVILAHSLISSMDEVNPVRTGITGISWGGYLTCIVANVDSRFSFAAPVYGCGYLGDNSVWLDVFKQMGEEKSRRWLALWDPSVYLARGWRPMLWVTGTNDFAYPMDSLQKSYRKSLGERFLCIRVNMTHAHGGPGENPEEIHGMADAMLGKGRPLGRVTDQGREGRRVWADFRRDAPLVKAELIYTKDAGEWQKRTWHSDRAAILETRMDDNKASGQAVAVLPEGATTWFMNFTDERDYVFSSEHEVIVAKE